MVRFMLAGVSGLLLFISASVAGAASLSVPDCGALLEWARGYDQSTSKQIAGRVQLANIFFDDVSSKAFGAGPWTGTGTINARSPRESAIADASSARSGIGPPTRSWPPPRA